MAAAPALKLGSGELGLDAARKGAAAEGGDRGLPRGSIAGRRGWAGGRAGGCGGGLPPGRLLMIGNAKLANPRKLARG